MVTRMRLIIAVCLIFALIGCSMSERRPGLDRSEYASFKSEIREKAEACQASEQDLLPQSVKAIAHGNTDRIIEIYLSIYDNPDLPKGMQAESLYQIGLIYMNEYNEQRDDDQAFVYFNRLKTEFPTSGLCAHVDKHMQVITSRKMHTPKYNDEHISNMVAAIKERASNCVAEESALLPQAVEAISTENAYRAIQAFLQMANDQTLNQASREQALYQVALIYMNTNNVHRDDRLAIYYFEQLLVQYPESSLCHNAREHIHTLERRIKS